jgi:hypothetical protein
MAADDDIRRAREILGVGPEAADEEVQQAYRDLVKVWHPDRFAHDDRMHARATDRLKEINWAYDFHQRNRDARRDHSSGTTEPQPEPAFAGDPGAESPDGSTGSAEPSSGKWSRVWSFVTVAVGCGLVGMAVLAFLMASGDHHHDSPGTDASLDGAAASSPILQNSTPPNVAGGPERAATKPVATVAAAAVQTAPTTNPASLRYTQGVLADQLVVAADDFVVDVWHNGTKIPDAQRRMANEVYGAMSERISLTVSNGDWVVFNVVNNRLRWGGVHYFAAAGMLGTRVRFVSHSGNGCWTYCDDPALVNRFIAERDFPGVAVRPITKKWDRGDRQMEGLTKSTWRGEGVWGEARNTWIKFIAWPGANHVPASR